MNFIIKYWKILLVIVLIALLLIAAWQIKNLIDEKNSLIRASNDKVSELTDKNTHFLSIIGKLGDTITYQHQTILTTE